MTIADFMHPPEILGIDLASYTGKAGQVIRVQAHDDVMVQRVSIVIADADKQIVEQELATGDASGLWWTYITTENCPTLMATIVAHAEDLTGHWVEQEEKEQQRIVRSQVSLWTTDIDDGIQTWKGLNAFRF